MGPGSHNRAHSLLGAPRVSQPHQQRLEASLREVEAALQDIDALQRNIATLATQSSKNLKTLVNLGSEMYMRAVVPDASRICVEVGLGFYAEFTLHEAQQFLRKKREATERCVAQCGEDAPSLPVLTHRRRRRKATLDEQLAETTAHAHTVRVCAGRAHSATAQRIACSLPVAAWQVQQLIAQIPDMLER